MTFYSRLILHPTKLIGAGALILGLSACKPAAESEKVEVVRPAKLITVSASSNVKNYSFPAVIEAATSRDLAFQVSGQIIELNLKPTSEVKKGAVIAKLDQRQYRNELQSAQTQFDNAKSEFERAQRLIAQDAIAKNVFDQRKSQFNVASAQLDNAKKALEDTVLYSPFDGVVAAKLAKELETVGPSTPVITLQTYGAAEAVVKIPANLVARSKQINPLETMVILDSTPGVPMPAEFVEASGLADEKSQTFEVKFGFTPPESLTIWPGMTGVVNSKISFIDDVVMAITIPLNSVLSDGEGQYVWLAIGEPITVTRRNIKVGASVGESLAVTSGLQEGDVIVGAGASYLFEGMKIRRLED